MNTLDTAARALADVDVGVACAGTALESRTYQVNKKSFLFVGKKDARLKLDGSAEEADRMGFAVGANGWVKLLLTELPPVPVVRRWVAESYGLMAGAARPKEPARKRKPPRSSRA